MSTPSPSAVTAAVAVAAGYNIIQSSDAPLLFKVKQALSSDLGQDSKLLSALAVSALPFVKAALNPDAVAAAVPAPFGEVVDIILGKVEQLVDEEKVSPQSTHPLDDMNM
jgi:hypothetical protein